MTAVTQWFVAGEKPAHVGPYEKDWRAAGITRPIYQFWNGFAWCRGCRSAEEAAEELRVSEYQTDPWRGLAEQPK
jgi:hypothetical protein